MGDMKEIGLMEGMMGTALRVGPEGVDTKGSIGRDRGMDMVFISFIQGIHILENGVMDKVMGLEFKLVLMGAVTLGSSSVVLNMALDVTISGII